ncbi:MAG: tRNA lysidine(34) synthetase TilS [Dehalococcoidia bacterium]
MQLQSKVKAFMKEKGLLEGGGTLLVGVSGGADSVCLLHLLNSISQAGELDLHVAHLDHQIRGTESEADAAYVADLSRKLGIKATVESRDVRKYQAENRCSLEEAAREVRYSFFADVSERINASAVAVGHTADDQAETIIMHLIRGTGLSGLKGMRPLSRWCLPDGRLLTVVRPLLEVTHEEAVSCCQEAELYPRTDSSNLSPEYLRNRIRAEIMPVLAEYNPNVVESVARTARIVADHIDWVEAEVGCVYGSVIKEIPGGVAIDNDSFNSLAPALRRNLLRRVIRDMAGSLRDIELVHIESLMDVLARPAGKELALPYGLTLYGDYEQSYITAGKSPLEILPPIEGEHRLRIPGETVVPGWRVKADVLPGKPEVIEEGDFTAFIDLDLAGGDLIVRSRHEGDRFQPLGMDDIKKLKDFMIDARIPRVWRDRVPLVCSAGTIVWVVGWRIDHRVRITDYTQRTLRLEFEME